jgi:NADPH:quinone reductase-like Zn-dependent oxidoreductase
MKAVRLHREGGPEQLVYEDAPKPQLGAGDALIRVHATGITPAEKSSIAKPAGKEGLLPWHTAKCQM